MSLLISQNSQSVWHDIVLSLLQWRQWGYLAKIDIVARYRRSIIGPFWLTLTSGIMLVSIGFTYSFLWGGGDIKGYMSFFGASYILWNSFAAMLGDATEIYGEATPYLQNYNTPKFFWVLRAVARNMLTLAHMIPLYIGLALFVPIFHVHKIPALLVALPIFVWHQLWISALVAAIATRFHDLKRLIPLLVSMLFLVTPILWRAEILKDHTWIYEFNPVYYIIDVVRRPLVGDLGSERVWIANIIIGCIGTLIAAIAHKRVLRRVFYWL